ncbi:MAG: hypothetical protein IPM39_00580 [Chloroflexi bacterium]|nr:hypothetical protein [Chloroflexota bacterium]
MRQRLQQFLFPIVLLLLAACAAPTGAPTAVPSTEPTITPTAVPSIEPTSAPTAVPPTTTAVNNYSTAVEYNLGETTIVQQRFPEDSRFRNMPVRLNGLIAVPAGDDGPYPIVVILHGTHPGCPVDETDVDRWPCAPEDERANYRGFAYLVSHLAQQGYVGLSLNINGENTFGFGEPDAGERLQQIVDLHLSALAQAAAGGPNEFGVPLEGRADPGRMVLIGHSRGGEGAFWLATEQGWAAPDAFDRLGYGPVDGLLLLAPAVVFHMPEASPVPLSVILPACDGDVVGQDGQLFYDVTRLALGQNTWATSVWLEQANHNYFNETLADDAMGRWERPDCEPILTAAVQRDWLNRYTTEFLTAVFGQNQTTRVDLLARLGMDVTAPAVTAVTGLPALVSALSPADNRQTLLLPAAAEELTTHLLGGAVAADGLDTHFCPQGFYSSVSLPGSEPCRRNYVTVPGQPGHVVLSWETAGAALRFAVPAGNGDLSGYTALSLRTAVDPASPLNPADAPQAFSVRLTDNSGASASVATRPDEPALRFPPGVMVDVAVQGTNQTFSGLVPLTTLRLPLNGFAGVDLSQIREIALVFDQTPSGALFMADVEVVRPSNE